MNFDTYQAAAAKTAIYPKEHEIVYPILGLTNETGELAGKLKKILRGDGNTGGSVKNMTPDQAASLHAELGDVLWYLAAVCTDLGFQLYDIAEANIAKLKDRADRGKLRGDGDKR